MVGLADYNSRDWHLDVRPGEGKRILSLDGGGVRGLITLGILQRVEEQLRSRFPGKPEDFRLCHYFDLIAGTSTGAIIATALALGMSVAQVRSLYLDMCPKLFSQTNESLWSMFGFGGVFAAKFDTEALERELKKFLGDRRLGSMDLRTGLMLCMKRIDTGSPWVLTNSPNSAYYESPNKEWRPNKDYEVWRLIRASSAAPMMFEPVEVTIAEKDALYGEEVGVFVDGAVAGLNNPALQAYLTATIAPYGFSWPSGKDHLMVVSVGTGWWRDRQKRQEFMGTQSWRKAMVAIVGMIQDTSLNTQLALQAMSSSRKPWHLNGEVKGLDGHLCHGEDVLSYQRYDASLESGDIAKVLTGTSLSQADVNDLREIGTADPEVLKRLFGIGYAVGRVTRPGVDGIEAEDFPAIFDPPGFSADKALSSLSA